MTTLLVMLIKIGAKVVSHARYTTFQMAEVAIPRHLFRTILRPGFRVCEHIFGSIRRRHSMIST
jgi:hypothetical protein